MPVLGLNWADMACGPLACGDIPRTPGLQNRWTVHRVVGGSIPVRLRCAVPGISAPQHAPVRSMTYMLSQAKQLIYPADGGRGTVIGAPQD